ncbi:hepatic leukemia factor-like [Pectinophora gossypiella]|uniref:hepatic leukemia factor-like n=1 Tax=Pectinophora gossypiella TaxID=13191 RepID=UPI00214E8AB2|nr:hepatic leukemia factor-like [Pectinophora gossypiella]
MSFWTPYTGKALDLTKTVKEERLTPPLVPETPTFQYAPRFSATEHFPNPYASITSPEVRTFDTRLPSPDAGRTWSPYSKNSRSPVRTPELYDADSLSDDVEYQAFERDALRAMAEKNGGTLLGNNPRMRRAVQTSQAVDDLYRKQRERNNFAAKQSRDRRKLREVRLAFQVTFLQKKLSVLRAQLGTRYCTRCQFQC